MTNNYLVSRDTCPACHAEKIRSLYRCAYTQDPLKEYLHSFYGSQGGVELEYLEEGDYHLVECLSCGLVYQKDVGGDELMLRLYERWIDPELAFQRHLNDAGIPLYSRHAEEVMQIITFLGKVPSELDMLDFGMGWGRWARMANAFGCKACGAELSPKRIEYAAQHGIEAVDWDDIPNRQFDLINTEQVFEHIADPLDTLRHLIQALKPDGLVKLSVPDGTPIHQRLKHMDWKAPIGSPNSLHAVAPLEHINCFSRPALINMAKLAGLEAVLMPMGIQYRFTTCWVGWDRIKKNLLLPIYYNVLGKGTYMFFRRAT